MLVAPVVLLFIFIASGAHGCSNSDCQNYRTIIANQQTYASLANATITHLVKENEQLSKANEVFLNTTDNFNKILKCIANEKKRAEVHRSMVHAVYDASTYPNSFNIAFGGMPFPDVFTDDVMSRFEELGYKFDKHKSKEYYSILTAFPQLWTVTRDGVNVSGVAYNTDGIMLKSSNNGTLFTWEWTFRFKFLTGDFPNGNYTVDPIIAINITQNGWTRHRCSDGKIMRLKANVPRLRQQFISNYLYPANPTSIINSVCGVHDQYCVPRGFSQYNNISECLSYVATLPDGDPDRLGTQKSKQCLQFHVPLAIADSDVHCQHLGPQSDPCKDFTSQDFYDGLYNLDIPEGEIDPQDCSVEWNECQHLLNSLTI